MDDVRLFSFQRNLDLQFNSVAIMKWLGIFFFVFLCVSGKFHLRLLIHQNISTVLNTILLQGTEIEPGDPEDIGPDAPQETPTPDASADLPEE